MRGQSKTIHRRADKAEGVTTEARRATPCIIRWGLRSVRTGNCLAGVIREAVEAVLSTKRRADEQHYAKSDRQESGTVAHLHSISNGAVAARDAHRQLAFPAESGKRSGQVNVPPQRRSLQKAL